MKYLSIILVVLLSGCNSPVELKPSPKILPSATSNSVVNVAQPTQTPTIPAPTVTPTPTPKIDLKGKFVYSTTSELYTINADGSNKFKLPINLSRISKPIWSPDGKKIIFINNDDPRKQHGKENLYVVNYDGSQLINLTKNEDKVESLQEISDASWSPDGKKILFSNYEKTLEGISKQGDIYTANTDGSQLIALTKSLGTQRPVWSPDSQRVAYSTYYAIYVVNADGSNDKLLTEDNPDEVKASYERFDPLNQYNFPSWSPDGSNKAVINRVYNIDLQYGHESFKWSPDSQKIAFVTYNIAVIGRYGNDQGYLTSFKRGVFSPTWTSDGSKIIFYSKDTDNNYLYVINSDGSNLTKLDIPTNNLVDDFSWNYTK